ncbi:hypothetical protein Xcel_2664 [Xylanimonas cellulosilytica DSM 15894]|uniref:Uncharacterized protein n=1 Tax=Xylanimonas cellulosilytica (strain DSM 15894 / JCM 12276 / CECT 5975 / KCTC 9989 / LMG 20990 / NBRC 107835 / XIL07) TaxID=446471 RepID=D1BXN7_XYLCX|nr:YesL family protein [Xylanimonas cellulosilytica]ACZ31678.1 hypothetical protein Xcel_2664 [Xylanimonas cellulosilytica DSM 15894]
MTTDAHINPFEPPEQRRVKIAGDFNEGVLGRATKAIYWYIVLTLLLAIAALPTLVLTMLLVPEPSNIPFFALACLPLGPALSAGLFTVRARYTDEDLAPSRTFWRGYRRNWKDALRLWVPALVVVGIIGYSVAFADLAGIGAAYRIVLIVIAVVVALFAMHALVISTFFSFRVRDVSRLTAYYLVVLPKTTFGIAAMLIISATAAYFSPLLLGLLGGILTWFWYQIDKVMLTDIWTRFTKPSEEQAAG